jgi:transcriptional regulator with XRE-family HTH domain
MIGLEYIIQFKGLKKKDVAEIVEAFPQALNDWLKQRRPIPKEKLEKLSNHFNIPSDLIENEISMANKIEIERLLLPSESDLEKYIPKVLSDLEKHLRDDEVIHTMYRDYTTSESTFDILTDLVIVLNDVSSTLEFEKLNTIKYLLTMLYMYDKSWEKNFEDTNNDLWKDLFYVLKRHHII